MSYPGNPALAADVQERISNTFQQTLGLVTQQRDQEALVGCEFILRMDPQFQPAKTLVERLKSDTRPVVTIDLEAPSPPPANTAAATVDEPALDDLDGLDDLDALEDLEDLEGLAELDDLELEEPTVPSTPATPTAMPVSPTSGPVTSGLGTMMQDLLDKRSFAQILQVAEMQKDAVAGDPQVQAIVEQAQGLLESEAYVSTFLKAAVEARSEGRLDDMEKDLAKARALDPGHPGLLDFAPAAESAPPGETPLSFDSEEPAFDFGDSDSAASSGDAASSDGAASSNNDLMALQAQSLSLDSSPGEPADPMAGLASDPRQTKPMAAVSVDDASEVSFEGASFADDGDSVLTFDAEPEVTDESFAASDAEQAEIVDGFEVDQGADVFSGEPALGAEEASGGEDNEGGGERVSGLLAEGQEAFDRGEYQAAIDVWSRIFLIDIENTEASDRIEEARNKKAEQERQAEELFHEAVTQIEAESLEEAQTSLRQVLEIQPTHSLASEYLNQLEAGQVPTVSAGGDLDSALEDLEGREDFAGDAASGADSPSLDAAVQRDRVVVVKKTDMKIVLLGAAVLLAVIGGIAFLLLQWDTLFPNQEPPPTMAQQRRVDPIERATKMHENGATENAILQLERIQAQDPIYEKAQALIAQWKALVEAPPETADSGPSDEQRQRFDLLLSAARDAHRQQRYLRARDYFDRAAKILPLTSADLTLKAASEDELQPLQSELKLFAQGEYASVIPNLWRKRESAPEDRVIHRLLVDSYYNLALTDLQRGNTAGAAAKVKEILEIDPENEELERLRLFAETYSRRPQDLLYRIFVKYLPSR